MAKYARGKKSYAISDRGGLRVKYTELKTTWDGLRVSPDDWEPKHPQLTPAKNVVDATALFNPRPDNDPENVEFFVGYNYDIFTPIQQRPPVGIPGHGVVASIPRSSLEYELSVTGVSGTVTLGDYDTGTAVNGLSGTAEIGDYTEEAELTETGLAGDGDTGTAVPNIVIDISVTGLSGTGALGDFDTATVVSGLASTGSLGTFIPESEITENGVAGAGALGTFTEETELEETGVSGTAVLHVIGESGGSEFRVNVTGIAGVSGVGTIDEEEAVSEISETGLGGTGAIGTVTLAVGYGNGAWGDGTWGNGV
jgi:hypothetical protein